ncbi:MAG: hypothetical protein JRI68_30870 [Deltaproteobacteria bacterium]|nr:hypothetical protein [Deltaproteobacteria bacterium]
MTMRQGGDRRLSRTTWIAALVGAGALLGLPGCSDDDADPVPPDPPPTTFGGDRPVELWVPTGYDPAVPTPLLFLLHGYSVSGAVQEMLFSLRPEADARTVLYAHPDGSFSEDGKRFWNATEACCDFLNSGVDDSAYLRGLIDDIRAHYNVDDRRIYFTGHSNGSYMSYRMACDHDDIVAGIAGLAGAMLTDPTDCDATEPVHVLHIHGTEDASVLYEGFAGSTDRAPYPSATEGVADWAERGGCDATPTDSAAFDLDGSVAGAETTVSVHEGCDAGGSAELWTIVGGEHVPALNDDWPERLLDWLLERSKP